MNERRTNPPIDPQQFGEMVGTITAIKDTLVRMETNQTKIFELHDTLREKVEDLNVSRGRGIGILTGVALLAGGLGSGAHSVVDWAKDIFK